jgi:membrane associated rhomboid family serine protease
MAFSILGLFTVTWLMGGDEATSSLYKAGILKESRLLAGEWWRLVSSEFVHSDWHHVLSNCTGLVLLGLALESRVGTLRTAQIYLLGAIGSSAVMIAICRSGGGASSAIYALLGAYLSRPFRRQGRGGLAIRLGWLVAAGWTLRGLGIGSENITIGHESHVAGLVVGLCCGALLSERGELEPGGWVRPRRFATAALASLGLIVALAPESRWSLGWHRSAAVRAERVGDLETAAQHWTVIEMLGDARSQVDAVFIENAARFRLRRHDYVGARDVLASVAPTLDDAKTYRDTGFLMAQYEPFDDRRALSNWRKAMALDPSNPEVLDAIAMAIVSSEDATVGRPQEARWLAQRAVDLDGRRTPEFLRTLAWAHYHCGDIDESVSWMRRAIERNDPGTHALYVDELKSIEQRSRSRFPKG